jgi:hypothetical protein
MPKGPKKKSQKAKRPVKIKVIPQVKPTGGTRLSKDRMPLVAAQWKKFASGLRRMDEVSLGDTEPATLLVWRDKKI